MENSYRRDSMEGAVKNLGTPFSIKDILTRSEPSEILVKKFGAEFDTKIQSSVNNNNQSQNNPSHHHYNHNNNHHQKRIINGFKESTLLEFEKSCGKSSSTAMELNNFPGRDYPEIPRLPLSMDREKSDCGIKTVTSYYAHPSLAGKVVSTVGSGDSQRDYSPPSLAYFGKVLNRSESHPLDMRRLIMTNLDSGKFTTRQSLHNVGSSVHLVIQNRLRQFIFALWCRWKQGYLVGQGWIAVT